MLALVQQLLVFSPSYMKRCSVCSGSCVAVVHKCVYGNYFPEESLLRKEGIHTFYRLVISFTLHGLIRELIWLFFIIMKKQNVQQIGQRSIVSASNFKSDISPVQGSWF